MKIVDWLRVPLRVADGIRVLAGGLRELRSAAEELAEAAPVGELPMLVVGVGVDSDSVGRRADERWRVAGAAVGGVPLEPLDSGEGEALSALDSVPAVVLDAVARAAVAADSGGCGSGGSEADPDFDSLLDAMPDADTEDEADPDFDSSGNYPDDPPDSRPSGDTRAMVFEAIRARGPICNAQIQSSTRLTKGQVNRALRLLCRERPARIRKTGRSKSKTPWIVVAGGSSAAVGASVH